jgi:hypothetical protein
MGSLAQAARSKKLRQARTILIVIGILNGLLGLGLALGARPIAESLVKTAVEKELRNNPGAAVDPAKKQELENQVTRILRVGGVLTAILGLVFLTLAALIHRFPVPATVTALVLYLGVCAIDLAMGGLALNYCAIAIRVLIVVALFQAVLAAIAYQKERAAATVTPEDLEPEYD